MTRSGRLTRSGRPSRNWTFRTQLLLRVICEIQNPPIMRMPLTVIAVMLALLGCSTTSPVTNFYPWPAASWKFPPKNNPEEILFLTNIPKGGFVILGEFAVGGTAQTSYQEMIDLARNAAARMGADFIITIRQGVEQKSVSLPGLAINQSSVDVSASGTHGFASGSGQGNSTGISVGPSTRTYNLGSMNFLLGKYPKVWGGIFFDLSRADGRAIITGFSWDSPAPESGFLVGDEVVAVDGYGIDDLDGAKPAFYSMKPGDIVDVVIKREGRQMTLKLRAIPRFGKSKEGN